METDDKYYTPEITEFRPGFEFEALIYDEDRNRKWINAAFIEYGMKDITPGSKYYGKCFAFINSLMELENSMLQKAVVRVKYLDIGDIEELGWTKVGKYDDKDNYIIPYFKKENVRLYPYGENQLTIGKINEKEDLEVLFQGTIKNKSELELIMKMLGI